MKIKTKQMPYSKVNTLKKPKHKKVCAKLYRHIPFLLHPLIQLKLFTQIMYDLTLYIDVFNNEIAGDFII